MPLTEGEPLSPLARDAEGAPLVEGEPLPPARDAEDEPLREGEPVLCREAEGEREGCGEAELEADARAEGEERAEAEVVGAPPVPDGIPLPLSKPLTVPPRTAELLLLAVAPPNKLALGAPLAEPLLVGGALPEPIPLVEAVTRGAVADAAPLLLPAADEEAVPPIPEAVGAFRVALTAPLLLTPACREAEAEPLIVPPPPLLNVASGESEKTAEVLGMPPVALRLGAPVTVKASLAAPVPLPCGEAEPAPPLLPVAGGVAEWDCDARAVVEGLREALRDATLAVAELHGELERERAPLVETPGEGEAVPQGDAKTVALLHGEGLGVETPPLRVAGAEACADGLRATVGEVAPLCEGEPLTLAVRSCEKEAEGLALAATEPVAAALAQLLAVGSSGEEEEEGLACNEALAVGQALALVDGMGGDGEGGALPVPPPPGLPLTVPEPAPPLLHVGVALKKKEGVAQAEALLLAFALVEALGQAVTLP